MLFERKLPTNGVYFFEINVISYMPAKGCEFTIGVANYL